MKLAAHKHSTAHHSTTNRLRLSECVCVCVCVVCIVRQCYTYSLIVVGLFNWIWYSKCILVKHCLRVHQQVFHFHQFHFIIESFGLRKLSPVKYCSVNATHTHNWCFLISLHSHFYSIIIIRTKCELCIQFHLHFNLSSSSSHGHHTDWILIEPISNMHSQ